MARLNPITGLADSLNPLPSGGGFTTIYAIAVQSDGKIITGGDFTALSPNGGSPVTRNHIARLERDGRLDQTLNLTILGGSFPNVTAIAAQPDGKILIGGNFTSVLDLTRNSIARLNTDGTLDTGFQPERKHCFYLFNCSSAGRQDFGRRPFHGQQHRRANT